MNEGRLPVTILTGFLGAGKTTVLNRILAEQHGHRIAVIENEFGPEGIDNEILVSETGEEIVEMNNGCVCCSVRGDLKRILDELARRRAAGEISFERVIVETTGMADPGPVAQTFFLEPSVAALYRLDAVVAVVDGRHGLDTLARFDEARAQVGFADRLVISKRDLASADELAALRSRLAQLNGQAPVVEADFGTIPIAQFLDIGGFDLRRAVEIEPDFLGSLAAAEPVPLEHGHGHKHGHEHGDAHGREHHGEHAHADAHPHRHDDDIRAFAFTADAPLDSALLEQFLAAIVEVCGPDLFRCKGVLWIDGVDHRVILQGVQLVMAIDRGRPWEQGAVRGSKLVFIGRDLPEAEIHDSLRRCLVAPAANEGRADAAAGPAGSGFAAAA